MYVAVRKQQWSESARAGNLLLLLSHYFSGLAFFPLHVRISDKEPQEKEERKHVLTI